uniref:Uncharacterized protein n=1 Tax=Suricata suricatta TaxID=37032 RepID=A0A673TJE9_SURSU
MTSALHGHNYVRPPERYLRKATVHGDSSAPRPTPLVFARLFLLWAAVAAEEQSYGYGSARYLLLCGLGGMLSCGLRHTAIVPLDLVKCQVGVACGRVTSCGRSLPGLPSCGRSRPGSAGLENVRFSGLGEGTIGSPSYFKGLIPSLWATQEGCRRFI